MKFELNVIRFDVADVVTTSGCADPTTPVAFGGNMSCEEVIQ